MKIEVTNMRLKTSKTRLRAVASITLNDAIAIHDIKIIERVPAGQYFIALPSFLDSNKKYRNIVHPITKEMRQDLEEKVLAAFFIEKNKHHKENDNENTCSN